MSRIRGVNTRPELAVRSYLHRAGFRFRLHVKGMPGRPDVVLKKHRATIFVHGCFWHRHPGCKFAYTPKSRIDAWTAKFLENTARDRRNEQELRHKGWRVFIVWECELNDPLRLSALAVVLRAEFSKKAAESPTLAPHVRS